MKKFNSYQEMYDFVQSYHGGKGDPLKLLQMFEQMEEEETFGWWDYDGYQCGNDLSCDELTHYNNVDGKTHVFYFYSDGSDTVKDDKVFADTEDALDATVDYDFLDDIAKELGVDSPK